MICLYSIIFRSQLFIIIMFYAYIFVSFPFIGKNYHIKTHVAYIIYMYIYRIYIRNNTNIIYNLCVICVICFFAKGIIIYVFICLYTGNMIFLYPNGNIIFTIYIYNNNNNILCIYLRIIVNSI